MPRPAFVSAAAVLATHRLPASAVSSSRSSFVAANPPRFASLPTFRKAHPRRSITTTADMADFTTTSKGLKIKDVVVGTGPEVDQSAIGKSVNVHYLLTLNGFSEEKGQKVDSSKDRGRPFSYRCSTGSVIAGWDQGVMGMKVGGNRRLIIPPELGYGANGAGGVIPGGATLYFDIELLGIDS